MTNFGHTKLKWYSRVVTFDGVGKFLNSLTPEQAAISKVLHNNVGFVVWYPAPQTEEAPKS